MSRIRLATAAAAAILAVVGFATLDASAPTMLSPAGIGQAQQEDDIVRIGGDVKPPKKTKHVNPVYPEGAREAGIEGVVILETVIDKEGKVAHAEVVKSVPELDQAALDAVLQWEFEPTYVDGKKVRVRMTVTVNFTLAN